MRVTHLLLHTAVYCILAGCNPQYLTPIKSINKESAYKVQIPADETIQNHGWSYVHTTLSDGGYRMRTFYPEKNQCTHLVSARDRNFQIKEGMYKEWWDNGFKKTEGQYQDNQKVGAWKNYSFDTGQLKNEMEHVNGKRNGMQKNYSKHGLSSSYTYVMEEKEGPFIIYDSTGIVINEGIYKADTLFEQSIVLDFDDSTVKHVEVMPGFPGCTNNGDDFEYRGCSQKKMLMFIYGTLKYPADARENGLEGASVIRFTVDKDGSLIDITPLRGLCQSIENECLRVVHAMPKWEPGMQDGKPIKVQFLLPIKFKLQ